MVRHFHQLLGQQPNVCQEKNIIIAGRTQSGKSAVKAVLQSIRHFLKIPLIVVTKGVDESIDLHKKLLDFAQNTAINQRDIVVVSSKKDGCGHKAKNNSINTALKNGGTIILADTHHQVYTKACEGLKAYRREVPNGNFFLIIDEADAMFRTKDKSQQFEMALQNLRDMRPSMTTFISATPVPLLLCLVEDCIDDNVDSNSNLALFNLEPSDDYTGFEEVDPLRDINGKDIFLDQNEVSVNSRYKDMPYTTEKFIMLCDNALYHNGRRKGILLLDVSCPRVKVDNNVFEKAERVQDYYRIREKNIIVIVMVGEGIAVKFPNEVMDKETWKKSLIGNVLQHIDDEYGLEMPIFIFGFSKICRGTSIRSNYRVPTHMNMHLSRGHHISTVIQTLGRVTGNGKCVLKDNGFESVTVLTTRTDYNTFDSVQNYIDDVTYRVKKGERFKEALTGTNLKLPHKANFFNISFRELGPMKDLRARFWPNMNFEDAPPELSKDDEALKDEYWESVDMQRVFRSLVRLKRSNNLVTAAGK